MASKKKITTAVVAGVTAAALLLGGTFAWQSINQTALNEASDVVNPGGRLHDDFDGTNKDVYVENFADEEIFARIRLEEFFEVTQAGGTTHSIAGTRIDDETVEYVLHDFYGENATDAYWNWKTGGSAVFMPTFNKNKDSLVADINGTYDSVDDEGNRYSDYVRYYYGQNVTGDAIYDYDSNDVDEVGSDFDNLGAYSENVTTVSEEHTAKNTLGATLISMDEWFNEYDAEPGEYWVYDTDGWVYWAAPIAPGEATGLLLDGIELKDKMDDSWYYAINVVAQFITADDLGESDDTGFYADGAFVSDDALTLLDAIGVDVSGEADNNEGDEDDEDDESSDFVAQAGYLYGTGMSLYIDNSNVYVDSENNTLIINPVGNWAIAEVTLDHATLEFNSTTNVSYIYSEGDESYEEHHDTIVDCLSSMDWNEVEIYLSTISGGQYKITSTDGNEFGGSVEFTIVVQESDDPVTFSRISFSGDAVPNELNMIGFGGTIIDIVDENGTSYDTAVDSPYRLVFGCYSTWIAIDDQFEVGKSFDFSSLYEMGLLQDYKVTAIYFGIYDSTDAVSQSMNGLTAFADDSGLVWSSEQYSLYDSEIYSYEEAYESDGYTFAVMTTEGSENLFVADMTGSFFDRGIDETDATTIDDITNWHIYEAAYMEIGAMIAYNKDNSPIVGSIAGVTGEQTFTVLFYEDAEGSTAFNDAYTEYMSSDLVFSVVDEDGNEIEEGVSFEQDGNTITVTVEDGYTGTFTVNFSHKWYVNGSNSFDVICEA